jgi:dGTPase
VNPEQWLDLTHFEGNANAFRILTHQFKGRRKGGFALTYTTLASLVKYPFDSSINKKYKYGFFQTDKSTFVEIADELGLKKLDDEKYVYARHPLVYLVEAADDISYQVMDIEDAHKLRILSNEETYRLLTAFFDKDEDKKFFEEKEHVFKEVYDINEQIAYLRAKVINKLVFECINVFLNNYDEIMKGTFQKCLVDCLPDVSQKAMDTCTKTAFEKIYNDTAVIDIELAGYNILGTLLHEFIKATMNPNLSYSKKLLSLLPLQFKYEREDTFGKIQSILDFVSGMTDLYAVELYRNIKGISLGKIKYFTS